MIIFLAILLYNHPTLSDSIPMWCILFIIGCVRMARHYRVDTSLKKLANKR